MNWYLDVLKKYTVFYGRARRMEYWMFIFISLVIQMVLYFLDTMFGLYNSELYLGVLGGLYSLGVLLPTIGVMVRRLHDTGRSGYWILIGWVPLIGSLALLYFMIKPGDEGTNDYGVDPKAG